MNLLLYLLHFLLGHTSRDAGSSEAVLLRSDGSTRPARGVEAPGVWAELMGCLQLRLQTHLGFKGHHRTRSAVGPETERSNDRGRQRGFRRGRRE